MDEEPYFIDQRMRMVEEDLLGRDISNTRVLGAMGSVPRQFFIPPDHRRFAYSDGPLPIGEGQTISQPYIVAYMTQLLNLYGDERVLEVGTGSGYQAAVLSLLARGVHTIERHPPLADHAAYILASLGFRNVFVHIGDGSLGWPPAAPYDAVIVTAAAPEAPPPLLDQLADGGRMVIPVGGPGSQFLELWERHGPHLESEQVLPVAFVPLRGQFGWKKGWLGR